ncbi:MAG: hypothetical protein KAQ62_27140, partial [Cyclobacteriaceae bacterium]|nr:hypothetical protein [Cyclobacteriaceae bacterium]
GNYQVIAYDEYNCPSDPVTFQIQDNAVPPTFNLLSFDNISCDAANPVGSLVAQRPDNSYTISQYEWFLNAPVAGNEILPAIPPTDSIHYSLDAGNYAVRITDASTECTSVEFANIINLPANNPLIDTTYLLALKSCATPNGEFGLDVNPLELLPPLLSQNRTYTFYTENNTTLADTTAAGVPKLSSNPFGPTPNEVAFTGINFGDWTSLVVDNFTHCVSAPFTINLPQAPGVVLQVLDSILPPNCDPLSTGSFQIEASSGVNSAPGGAGFNFSWDYWGTQFIGPAVPNPGIIDGLQSDSFKEWRDGLIAGYYIVSVVDNFTSCVASDTFYLPIFNAPPSVLLGFADAIDCVPGNGEITFKVDEILDGMGVPVNGPANSYDVILYEGTTANPLNEMRRVILGAYNTTYTFEQGGLPVSYDIELPPGNYTLTTQENSTPNLCFSEPSLVSIGLDVPDPVIDTTRIADITCNLT